jgi:hypothetical protein
MVLFLRLCRRKRFHLPPGAAQSRHMPPPRATANVRSFAPEPEGWCCFCGSAAKTAPSSPWRGAAAPHMPPPRASCRMLLANPCQGPPSRASPAPEGEGGAGFGGTAAEPSTTILRFWAAQPPTAARQLRQTDVCQQYLAVALIPSSLPMTLVARSVIIKQPTVMERTSADRRRLRRSKKRRAGERVFSTQQKEL